VDSRARFEVLYRAHGGAVRSYARRRADAQTADDVTAEVFVIAWRRLDSVPDDGLPWLLGVARRVLANRRRGRAREAALHARLIAAQTTAAVSQSSQSEADHRVLQALSSLNERDREALLLIGWDGLAPAQAARVLGVSANTFAARSYRARRRFSRALAAVRDEAASTVRSSKAEVLR
jgi:RNA polymerase sigma-70 factor, ECF subfamily